jgi:nicotinamide riboside kinase
MEDIDTGTKKIRIAVIGPESTGKTELALWLANHLNGVYYQEIARDYVAGLNRHYNISDIDNIVQMQVEQYRNMEQSKMKFHVFDTEIIITKIWYEWVYGQLPIDFKSIIDYTHFDFYLLCATDIPWIPDSVRENGGEAREKLFSVYESELRFFGFRYGIVSGFDEKRRKCALTLLKNLM